jgi:hypothetical protein
VNGLEAALARLHGLKSDLAGAGGSRWYAAGVKESLRFRGSFLVDSIDRIRAKQGRDAIAKPTLGSVCCQSSQHDSRLSVFLTPVK